MSHLLPTACVAAIQLKQSVSISSKAHPSASKDSSKLGLSVIVNASNSSTSPDSNNTSGRGLLAACQGGHGCITCWQGLLGACCSSSSRSRRHHRFFQLSLDLTTLRWSWNKYVLMYFVDSISSSPSQLSITLHMVLEPDLQLTFRDQATWTQWLAGLQLVLQLLTGTARAAAQAAMQQSSGDDLPLAAAGQKQQLQPCAAPACLPAQESVCAAGEAAGAAEGSGHGQADAEGDTVAIMLPTAPAPPPPSAAAAIETAGHIGDVDPSFLLQHQLVRRALYSQQGLQQHPARSFQATEKAASCAGGARPSGCHLPVLLWPSR